MKRDDEAGRGPERISAAGFGPALKKGMGRAAVLLQKEPHDADLNAELLRACTRDLTYDRQCEASRVPYLYELIRMTGQAGAYRAALEVRLRAATGADPISDTEQVFAILCRLAAQDGGSQAVLRDLVLTTEDRALAVAGICELVRMQGIDALLDCVHRFGPEIAEDPWLATSMAQALEDRDGAPAATAALRQARRGDAALDRLMSLAEAETKGGEEPAAVPGYAALKAEVERGARKYFPPAWIKNASQAEIDCAAEDLIAEADEAKVMAYLTVFRSRAFPGDPTRLFPLLGSANRRVEFGAARALARVSHPAIRSFALHLIAERRYGVGTRLLRSSYGDGDLVLFRALLDQLVPDEDAYHGVGLSALSIIKCMAEMSEETRAILLHLYENEPCSLCRGHAVDLLAAAGGIPDWMAEEGRYDAEPSIAERFRPPAPRDH